MIQCEQNSTATPLFSIVIPVYNDWLPLEQCLQSLGGQKNAPTFEVIVVDDGSTEIASEEIRTSAYCYPLTLIRQPHRGIPSARNRGIRTSKGTVLLFADADCRLGINCLAALNSTIAHSPQHDCFQLRLVGNSSSLVGRAEDLRLTTFQSLMLQPDARIRYLNTAGFAIRRARLGIETDVFDPVALRAEDTLLLANLMQVGELPLFVPDAVVEHAIPLSLMGCLRKDIRSVYLERRAYDIIASKGVKIRVTHRERLRLLWSMWKAAGQDSIGRSAWFVLVVRQAFQRVISFGYQCLRLGFAGNV
ncbi:MAG: glycosyltransferase [Candidatus Sulfotelmatobacter sp.]|jgi:glycosyltransferase involved in cell wall biosynthesis